MATKVSFNPVSDRVFEVVLRYRSLDSRKASGKRLRFNQESTDSASGRLVPNDAIRRYFEDMSARGLLTAGLISTSTKPQLKAAAMKVLRSAQGRKKYWGGKNEDLADPHPSRFIRGRELPWGSRSLFDPVAGMAGESTAETGSTFGLVGATKSGKTTFLIEQLNLLPVGAFDLIVYFTMSPNATPLARLRPDLNVVVVLGFQPSIVNALLQKNLKTKNLFRFCTILDDVIDVKYSSTLNAQLLYMRNSNISTISVVQDIKMISRQARGQLNHILLFGWPTPDPIAKVNEALGIAGWAKEQMLRSDPDLSARSIRKDDIIRFVQKKLEGYGNALYIDQLGGKAPVFIRY